MEEFLKRCLEEGSKQLAEDAVKKYLGPTLDDKIDKAAGKILNFFFGMEEPKNTPEPSKADPKVVKKLNEATNSLEDILKKLPKTQVVSIEAIIVLKYRVLQQLGQCLIMVFLQYH
eukprot:TRINITY_DN2941_c0_g2_i2.p1 TRINITY_DN2941_c0_g2~~TRINITY_DN2941_c0_g2_i2.p1  ORF type:complete len:116 (+),score=21.60 TRINITY_DN2941_c0_g2_i2:177-524(+)